MYLWESLRVVRISFHRFQDQHTVLLDHLGGSQDTIPDTTTKDPHLLDLTPALLFGLPILALHQTQDGLPILLRLVIIKLLQRSHILL